MDRWKKAYEDWGFSELDHRWEGFIAYGAAAAFWVHLATWLLTRESLIPAVDDLGGWLTLVVMAIPGNIRAAFLIVLGPPRQGKWKTLWLSPRTNPLNQWQSNRRQAVRAQTPSKGGSRAGTLVKVLAGLTLFAVCAGYGITGGTIVEPSDSTTSPPRLRNQAEKRHMLELINDARVRNGARPVVMGTNNVAQIRADQLLRDCILSHWGTDGLKPYMRYSLAGGYQTNAENAYTANECGLADTWLQWNDNPPEMIKTAVESLLDSPGHRETMLHPSYRQVNIGLAWDRNTFKAIQHFEGDYVTLTQIPTIQDGELTLAGQLQKDYEFDGRRPLMALIVYDPKPRTLSPEQLVLTSCYSHGEVVAAIIPPFPLFRADYEYTETVEGPQCTDPYNVGTGAERPDTREDMERVWSERSERSERTRETEVSYQVMKARHLTVDSREFTLAADMEDLLEEHGPGVYTIALLADLEGIGEGETEVISEYSIFHDANPPRTYSQHK